jgi:hypothetical protein
MNAQLTYAASLARSEDLNRQSFGYRRESRAMPVGMGRVVLAWRRRRSQQADVQPMPVRAATA